VGTVTVVVEPVTIKISTVVGPAGGTTSIGRVSVGTVIVLVGTVTVGRVTPIVESISTISTVVGPAGGVGGVGGGFGPQSVTMTKKSEDCELVRATTTCYNNFHPSTKRYRQQQTP
jgi:hypothetical protein